MWTDLQCERVRPGWVLFQCGEWQGLRADRYCKHVPQHSNICSLTILYQRASLLLSASPLSFSPSAPCAPQDVAVDEQCADGAMAISWSPNPDAQYFHVAAVSNTGARLHCNSSGTACTMSDLPCGQNYNVTVLSVREGCESKPSAVVETSSGKAVIHVFKCKIYTSVCQWHDALELALQRNSFLLTHA